MKKNDIQAGRYYKFSCQGEIYDYTNSWDKFIAYFYYKGNDLISFLDNFNPSSSELVSRNKVPYGTILPNFSELKGQIVRCLLENKDVQNSSPLEEPWFNLVDEFGQPTDHFFAVSSGRYLEATETPFCVNQPNKTERGVRADRLEIENTNLAKKITALENQLEALREQHQRNLYTIDALRKYPSDEDALAALFVEAISTGADIEKMKDLMKKTGVTAKL